MHTVKKNEIRSATFLWISISNITNQVEFLSDYYFYLLEIGQKAILILNQLLEIDPSNENWHDEVNEIANISW